MTHDVHPGLLLGALRASGQSAKIGRLLVSGGVAALHPHIACVIRDIIDELRAAGPLSGRAAEVANAFEAIGLSRHHAAALLAGGRSLLNFVSSGGACAATGAASGHGDGAAPDGACRATGTP